MAEQSRAEKLLAEMDAKYGKTSGNQPTAVPQPAPVPPPVQQPPQPPGSMIQRAVGIIGGRKNQLDKAIDGYSCGGKVKAHAQGGKISGPGTAKSDSIPAQIKETKEPILVSNGERIVSAKQDQILQRIAEMLGFETVDQMFEQMTGEPVGPTMKDGVPAAYNGGSEEELARLARVAEAKRTGNLMATSQPTIGTPETAKEYGNAINSGPSIASQMFPNTSAVWNEAGKDVGSAMQSGNYANAFGHAVRGTLASGVGLLDDVIGNPIRAVMPVAKDVAAGVSGTNPTPQAKPAAEQKPVGILPEAIDPATEPNKYGPQQVSPLITGRTANGIVTKDTAQQYLGSDMNSNKVGPNGQKTSIFGSYDGKGVNDILDRENAAREGMINSMIQAQGGNGVGLLSSSASDQIERDNAEKTQRWRNDELMKMATRGNQGAVIEAMRANADPARIAATVRDQDLKSAAADQRNQVELRGQDLRLQGDIVRSAKDPLEQRINALKLGDAEQISALRGIFMDKTKPQAERDAALAQLNALSGKKLDENFKIATVRKPDPNNPGQYIEEAYVVNGHGGQNERRVGGQQLPQAPQSAIDFLKKNPDQAAAFKQKYGYLPS